MCIKIDHLSVLYFSKKHQNTLRVAKIQFNHSNLEKSSTNMRRLNKGLLVLGKVGLGQVLTSAKTKRLTFVTDPFE